MAASFLTCQVTSILEFLSRDAEAKPELVLSRREAGKGGVYRRKEGIIY